MEYTEFDRIRLDAFREISSIATGNAATSLSALLDRRVDITVPNIMVETLENIPDLLGGWEKTVTAVQFSVSGEVSGSILLVLSSSESLRLVNILTGQQVESLDEMGISALKELGNIVVGSFVRVLAEGLKVRIEYSVPGFAQDMVGAILDEILAHLSLETKHAVVVESEFIIRDKIYRGHLVFILGPKAVNNIIKALANWEA